MPPADQLTILFLAANPDNTQPLALDEEMHAIDTVLRTAEFRDYFVLRSHWAVRYDDLQELLLRYQPHIVHFSGHGSAQGEVLLKSAGGSAQPVTPAALTALFTILRDNIRCVVLNACYTQTQAEGIAGAIEFVVGMERAIADQSAIAFAAGFYLGLGYGRSVQTAFELGCNRIDLAGKGEIHRALRPPKVVQVPNTPRSAIPQLLALRSDPAQVKLVETAAPASAPAAASTAERIPPPADAAGTQGGKLTRLSGPQFGQFQRALLAAFDLNSLTQMVQFELDQNLAAIAGGSNLSAVVFELISWAQRTGNLDRLLDGALAQNSTNPELKAVNQALRG